MRSKPHSAGILMLLFLLLQISNVRAQDTLHLNYHHTQILPHDSTQAKIDKWIKSLNGQHVTIKVVGYYHRAEFKKFAQQRCDELFLVLNRKARALITIEFIGPKKGDDWQRTMVDIIYTGGGQAPTPVAKEKPAPAANAASDKPAANAAKKEEKKEEKAAKKEEKQAEKEEARANADEGKSKGKKPAADAPITAPKSSVKIEMAGRADDAGAPQQKEASSGFLVKQDEIKFLRNAKIIVAKTDNASYNSMMEKAVNSGWNFNSNVVVMPYREAVESLKSDKNAVILTVSDVKLEGKDAMDNKDNVFTKAVILEKAKGKISALTCIPEFSDDVTEAGMVFAVSALNSLLNGMEQRGLPDNRNFNAPYQDWFEMLAGKTLLLPKDMMTAGMPDSVIADAYKGKFEVVDLGTMSSAIVSKSNKACVVVSRGVVDGNLYYLHYIYDAASGNVLQVAQLLNTEGMTTKGVKAVIGSYSLNRYGG